MSRARNPINIREFTRKIEVDNQIPIQYYYRIADNFLKEANNHRQENNIIDLYILLLRYAGILSETIPFHRDYITSNDTEKRSYRKKLLDVVRELESIRPEVEKETTKVNKEHALKEQNRLNNLRKAQDVSQASSSRQPPVSRMASLWPDNKQARHSRLTLNIRRPVIPGTVPSAPPIDNLVIDNNAPLPSDLDESSFVDSSSSTTEKLTKRHDGGSTNTASSCIICFEAAIEGACVPCGHMAGCMSCLNEIKAKSWGCPVCRTKIELVLRLYAV
ncbi:PREDICTED: AMSH-like ubiquitin thioesterase 3 [Nicotiana attenuata]|uniref:Amsh-like ubiquitin thioesterase 3 n=1 Tax=Nicotiana attenuata TaxID=49451 RepID=A0A314LEA5_NICAT|nr:PREDICTED: AMSH-like ubiquitin thioesterase 3 [Nicotiana attenuata]OIT39916.1 amsh-like ubiquitin thioesterase 3 [Nicotiana attenuata]